MSVPYSNSLSLPALTEPLAHRGLHGYSHEVRPSSPYFHDTSLTHAAQNPTSLTPTQQRAILAHTHALLTAFCNGTPPKGSVAPWWETSREAVEMLLEWGVEYGEWARSRCAVGWELAVTSYWVQIIRTWLTSE